MADNSWICRLCLALRRIKPIICFLLTVYSYLSLSFIHSLFQAFYWSEKFPFSSQFGYLWSEIEKIVPLPFFFLASWLGSQDSRSDVLVPIKWMWLSIIYKYESNFLRWKPLKWHITWSWNRQNTNNRQFTRTSDTKTHTHTQWQLFDRTPTGVVFDEQ